MHHIETFRVALLLSGNSTLMFALAGELSSHVHVSRRQIGICRLTVHMTAGVCAYYWRWIYREFASGNAQGTSVSSAVKLLGVAATVSVASAGG